MRCILAFLITILFFGIAKTEAADWREYKSYTFPSMETGRHIAHKEYYDKDSIVKTKSGTVKVWTLAVTEGGKDDSPDRIQSLLEINCSDRVYQLLRLTRVYKDNRIEEDTKHLNNWDEISPGSNRESVYKIACQKKKK